MRLLLAGLLIFPTIVHAQTAQIETLDWLASSRLDAGEYKLLSSEDAAPPGSRWIKRRYLLKRVARLKGDPPEKAAFSREVFLKTERPDRGRRYLLFFDHKGRADAAIDLEKPGETALHERAFTQTGDEIRGRKRILKAARARLEKNKTLAPLRVDHAAYLNGRPGTGYLKTSAEFESGVYKTLFSGEPLFLIIPADPERLPGILEETKNQDPLLRAKAAWKLANYHTREVETLLRSLLHDSGRIVFSDERRTVYPVRQAAFAALTAMGVGTDRPQGIETPYPPELLE